MVGFGYWDGGEIGNWDGELGLGIGTGDCDWGLVVTFGWDRGGIGDWDWDLGIGDWDWDLGLRRGVGIVDCDWGLFVTFRFDFWL